MDLSIVGERFGRLTVIWMSSEIRYGCHTVLCRCDCGETISVPPFRLWSGQYKSCGCGRGKRIDPVELIGKRFGNLTVLKRTEHISRGTRTFLFRCDCGNLTYVPPNKLTSGNTKSCGCRRTRDISGKRFGSHVAVEPTGEVHPINRTRLWRCICDCGRTAQVSVSNLTSGGTRSCGCLRSDRYAKKKTGQKQPQYA